MGDIVNLRMVRKRKQRAEKEQFAAANREKHGRSRSERERFRIATDKAKHDLDQHRREKPKKSGD